MNSVRRNFFFHVTYYIFKRQAGICICTSSGDVRKPGEQYYIIYVYTRAGSNIRGGLLLRGNNIAG